MAILAAVAYLALLLYVIVLMGRLVLDWIRAYSRDFRPQGLALVLFVTVYTLTDPPVNALRRVIPPLRLGTVSLDLSLMILLLAAWMLLRVLASLAA